MNCINYKLKLFHIKELLFELLASLTIIFFCGCNSGPLEVALNTDNNSEGLSAVRKITDQVVLADVAKNANLSFVRDEAVMRLTDKGLLSEIAKKGKEEFIRISAVRNPCLTDEGLLVDLAINDKDFGVREAAVKKLSDLARLAKIAFEKEEMQLIYKFICAFDSVPQEHRYNHETKILSILHILSYPEIINEIGGIEAIITKWSKNSANYLLYTDKTKTSYNGTRTKEGECLYCSFKFKKLNYPIDVNWCTTFPIETTDFTFEPADIEIGRLIMAIFEHLSQGTLVIIVKNKENPDFRKAAVGKLTDQFFLAELVKNDKDWEVRKAAIGKITDQVLLAKIAKNYIDYNLPIEAVKKITYHVVIDYNLRIEAVKKITDQVLLVDITKNDKDEEIRKAAEDKLKEIEK